jgi:prepilin-type N-terminal cleavage/methylation domain-containing protein
MRRNQHGFTLIEMLIVLLLIAILAGMVFALMGLVGKNADKANTIRRVEMLANAVEEFRAEYGKYPPVPQYLEDGEGVIQPIFYEWAVVPAESIYIYGLPAATALTIMQDADAKNYAKRIDGRIFTFGLASFLMTRYEGTENLYGGLPGYGDYVGHAKAGFGILTDIHQNPKNYQWFDHNAQRDDGERDERAISRMKNYVDGAVPRTEWKPRTWKGAGYNNRHTYFEDAWQRYLRYESNPPYDSYKLWSIGPDGVNGTDDDIVAGREGQ